MSFKVNIFKNALKNKHQPAVTSHGETWSYDMLLKYSGSVNSSVLNYDRVGLYFEKSKEYILALFSLTLGSSSFVPLELISPKERLNYIINDAEIDVIITSLKYSKNDLSKLPKKVKILYIEDLMGVESAIQEPTPEAEDEPAYVIYTSGSTGNPKGVEVSYNGLSNVIEQQVDITDMNKSNFFLYLAISFDASLSDIYCSILSSSNLYINDCIKRDAIGLKNYFNDVKITHSDLPPSLLKLLSPNDFKTLKSVIIGGEVADYSSVQEYTKQMKVVNVYGPTEATICTSMVVCDENWSKPLIGNELENVGYLICDEKGLKITKDQIGKTGELVITGCQLALGYLNNESMTNSRFKTLFGERSYLTGDLVSYNEDGLIEFKGRVDRQIKYHGYLICLEEIESAVNAIKEIESVSVIFKNKKIYAYYEGNIQEKDIRTLLKNKIPNYMIPSFIINKELPKTVTGKNDGKLLSKQDSKSDEESIISSIFKDILKLGNDYIDPSLSFTYDLNGDSLDFVELHIELQQIGLNIQYDYLIEHNSVNDILNYSEKESIVKTYDLVENFNQLEMPKNIRKINKQKNDIALITGSTGFLGSKLLEKIIVNYKTVYCLIRSKTPELAEEKLLSVFKNNKLELSSNNIKKISFICGDLSEINLGLSHDDYNKISNHVDTVYHCAANVNNILTYSQLFESNVLSTVNIAKFIFDGRDKELHYASTLSVYVSSDTLNNSIIYENPLENDGHRLYSGYAQTKWLSEYYLNKINEISNNVFTYRFGLLTPSLKTFISTGETFLSNTIKDLKEIGSIPNSEIDLSMDITPLEIAVDAMSRISFENVSNIYNISSNYKLTLNKIKVLLNIEDELDVIDWFEMFSKYKVSQYMTDLNSPYTKQYNMNLFETTNIDYFDTKNSRKYINQFNIDSYLKRLINI
jgi:amino acid adenylation domain-containing protein/thioester reductase-like protein